MQAKGVVDRISSKEWPGRNGTVYLYSFQLQGDRNWYRTGSDKPTFQQGDFITFDYNEDNRGGKTIVAASVVKQAAAVAQAPAPRAAASSSGSKENWDARAKYWDDKEKREIEVVEPRITLAAARKDAIAVIGLALAHDAIVFGNANKGARLGIILGSIDEVTKRFYDQSFAGIATDAKASPEEGPSNDVPFGD